MSIKIAQRWFIRKMIDLDTITKLPNNVGDLGKKQWLPSALKSCPKWNKSSNLVTLAAMASHVRFVKMSWDEMSFNLKNNHGTQSASAPHCIFPFDIGLHTYRDHCIEIVKSTATERSLWVTQWGNGIAAKRGWGRLRWVMELEWLSRSALSSSLAPISLSLSFSLSLPLLHTLLPPLCLYLSLSFAMCLHYV